MTQELLQEMGMEHGAGPRHEVWPVREVRPERGACPPRGAHPQRHTGPRREVRPGREVGLATHAAPGADATAVAPAATAPWIDAEAGMATAEYAIATLAAVGLAGLLVVILKGDMVRGLLEGIIQTALSVV